MKRNILPMAFLLVLATAVAIAQAPTNSQPNSQSVPGQTAHSETQNNSAGSISGNASPTNTAPGAQNPQSPTATPNTAPGSTPDPTQPTIDKSAPPQSSTAMSGATASSTTDSATLKGQLESAYQAEPTLTGSNIQVNVTDTSVELTGSVPTGKEKITAKRIAQSYAGNRKVIDHMTVAGRGTAPANPGPSGTAKPK